MAAGLGALRSLRLAMTSGSSRFCQCLADILPVLSLDSVFFVFWEPNSECIQLSTKTPTSDHALT